MPGAPISRWTMSYFAASLVFLLAGLALMAGGFGFPDAEIGDPDMLLVVHLLAVGWLGLLFSGALLQFVPVLVAAPARLSFLAAPALVAVIAGLLCLVSGFFALGGHVGIDPDVLALGALLLVSGFGSLIAIFAATILSGKQLGRSVSLVLTGLAALAGTMSMGALFAGSLSGMADAAGLDDLLAVGVPFHAALGLLGWMTVTAMGVSYRLFAMFMLAPETEEGAGRLVMALLLALTMLVLALVTAMTMPQFTPYFLGGVLLFSLAVAVLYFRDVRAMYRARRRPRLELNSLAGLIALFFLAGGLVLLAVSQIPGMPGNSAVAAYYLLGLGWLSGLGLAQLYKIVPFLTWLESYGAVMGRAAVPRVQDLVDERHARAWFIGFYAAVAAGAVCILAGAEAAFRLATLCQGAAVLALMLEYIRARRLAYAPDNIRLPRGTVRPHLLFAARPIKE